MKFLRDLYEHRHELRYELRAFLRPLCFVVGVALIYWLLP